MAGAEWVVRLLRQARDWHARHRVAVRQAVGVFVAVDVAGSFSFVGQMMLNERRKDREALRRQREDEAFAGCERVFQRVFHRCETSNPAIWPLATAEAAGAAASDDGAPAVEWVRFEELLGLGGGGFYDDGGKAAGAGATQPAAKVVIAHREGRRAREAGTDPIPFWITAGVQARAAAAAAFAFGVERLRVQRLSALRFSVTYVPPPGEGPAADPRARELEELGSWCVDFLT